VRQAARGAGHREAGHEAGARAGANTLRMIPMVNQGESG
jgi:hypothetical protein